MLKNFVNTTVEYAIFEIHFMHEPSIQVMNFLEQVQRQINEMGIAIECHISGG